MYGQQRNRTKTKNYFIPKRLVALPALLKRRTKIRRVHTIKAELAARTLYVVDGDMIIITSLDKKPFCCQDELSVMARPELCRVARELNKKLPRALYIESTHQVPSAEIRVRIEEMMGFRHLRSSLKNLHAGAPTHVPIDAFILRQIRGGKRPPNSSFSSCSSWSSAPYCLSVVAEVDEEVNWSVSKHDLPRLQNIYLPPQT